MLAALLLLAGTTLQNPSFEAPGDAPAKWTVETGAKVADRGPASTLVVDREVARDGKASLRLGADSRTVLWRMATQTLPVREGDRVLFRVAARCRGVKHEGFRYANANALLAFFASDGRRLGLLTSAVLRGDREWVDLHVHAIAPPRCATVKAGLFMSVGGTVWFDDARLSITPTGKLDAKARALAYDVLRLHLDRTYPHFGVEGKPKPADLPADPAREDVAEVLKGMLAPLGDVHVWFEYRGKRYYPSGPNRRPRNWNAAAIAKALTKRHIESKVMLVGEIGEAGYIGLAALDGREARDPFEPLTGAKGLILDLRMCTGGDERVAWRLASRFLRGEKVYARSQVRDPTLPGLNGFQPPRDRSLRGPGAPGHDGRRLIVLQGPHTVSSAEALVLMLRTARNVTTVGLPTAGASGNPKPFPLFRDLTVWTSTWRSMTPEGEPIEGVGVAPGVRVDAPATGRDPALERALEILRRRDR